MLVEKAAEARNNISGCTGRIFTQKFSREECNLDVINRLLLISDPLITSLRPTPKKKTTPFTYDAIELLIPAEPFSDNDESDSVEVSEDKDSKQDKES